MTKVETFNGVDISLNSSGRFEAHFNGKKESAASLAALKSKIKAAHIGSLAGRVEGLQVPPRGSIEYGFTAGETLTILGIASEKHSRGYRRGDVQEVYVIDNTQARYGGPTTTRGAGDLVRPNPEALAKLKALHEKFTVIRREMTKEAENILANEFEHVTAEEVRTMLES
jgi:hypothetical protein